MRFSHRMIKPRPHTAIGKRSTSSPQACVLRIELAHPLRGLCLKLGNGFITPCALLDGAIPIVRNHQAQTLPGGLSNKLRGLALCRLRIDRKRPSNTP
jgi:hypothetical protein